MRIFIAIQFSEEFKDEIEEIQYSFIKNGVDGNYTEKNNLHLTLAFIGEYEDPLYVKKVIDKIKFRPFSIKLEKMGAFHSLWWIGLQKSNELKMLVKRLRQDLERAGVPYDTKEFLPHITLIRKPRSPYVREIPGEFAEYVGEVEMTVNRISLMRSNRDASGKIFYTEIK
ncbi:RNA 2',3'-cyclic phosphodiesterase [bacterium]|nr:RNA 2',3'-cyclic phosphodiesterase [bacterium]